MLVGGGENPRHDYDVIYHPVYICMYKYVLALLESLAAARGANFVAHLNGSNTEICRWPILELSRKG